MQIYKPEDALHIKSLFSTIHERHLRLSKRMLDLIDILENVKAMEYMSQGGVRRLNIICRCIENIFLIFPVDREDLLTKDELKDISINLHAFFVNIFGLLDNLAWVVVYEKKQADSIKKKEVGLYKAKTQELFTDTFNAYLNLNMKKWYREHLQNFRDSLSHRVPLYVPPMCIDPKDFPDTTGRVCGFFVHSLSECGSHVALHAQVVTDFNTIEEIIEKFCEMFGK